MNGSTPQGSAPSAGPQQVSAGTSPAPRSPAISLPTGTRDILPEEMAELRGISARVLDTFTAAGYGEVATPALEFEETMRAADSIATERAYRLTDHDGKVLVARFDSTIPIARLAATRYRDVDPPLRFCYLQHVYRPIEPKRGQSREFLQIGMELLGMAAPAGDAEAITLLCDVLQQAGLNDFQIVVGDVGFLTGLFEVLGLPKTGAEAVRDAIVYEVQTRDFVGLERELRAATCFDDAAREQLMRVANTRGDRSVIELEGAACLIEIDDLLSDRGIDGRVIYDLGLVRQTGYYSGTVLEVYVPSSGFAIAGGGRYDDLVGKFGRELSAFGFAINMERLHLAMLAEQESA